LPENVFLVIAGSGPERQSLEALAGKLGVADKVRFTGQLENSELRSWYSAADALVLCSSREGWANVLLESMACGTPVIATNIWGTPEVVSTPVAGRLMADRTPAALAQSLAALLADYPSRADVRAHAEKFSWEATTASQLALFRSMADA
jgi:glycosyltransferase involved in cell wall biosynthesis